MHIEADVAFGELPATLACIVRPRSTTLLYPGLAWIAIVLLYALIVLGVVLGTRLHLVVVTTIIIYVLVRVIRIRIKLLQYTRPTTVLLLYIKPTLPVVVCIVVIVRLISVMTLLMHHLPGGL